MNVVTSRILSLAAFALVWASVAPTADGQSRRNRRDDRFPPFNRVNAVHERLKEQAKEAYAQGKYQQVVDLMNAVLRENPRDHFAYYYRGSAQAELGAASRSAKLTRLGIADAREAIRHDGAKTAFYYLPYLYGMSNLTAIEGRKDHAQTALAVAAQVLRSTTLSTADKANLYYQRGYAYKTLGRLEEAAKEFVTAIEHSRVHLGAHLEAARVYAAAGKTDQAKSQYDLAARTFSDNPMVFTERGVFLQSHGKHREAYNDFTTVIELNRSSPLGYLNRGFCSLGLGNAKGAEADFSKSLDYNARQPLAYVMRAQARLAQSNLTGATADNRSAIQLDPKNADAHAQLGFCLVFDGKNEDAVKAFEQAVKLNAALAYVAPWRFLSMQRAGRKDEALKLFAKELETSDGDRNWVENLLAFLAGKIDGKTLLTKVDQKDTGRKAAQTCEAHFFIGALHQAAGETGPAQQHFKAALATKQQQLSAYRGAEFAAPKPQ